MWHVGAAGQLLGHDPTRCADAGIGQNRGIACRQDFVQRSPAAPEWARYTAVRG